MEKITFIASPAVALKNSEGEYINEVRLKNPKYTLILLATEVQERLKSAGIDIETRVVDMKIMDPENEEKYGEVQYGSEVLEKYRVGASFEEIKDVIQDTRVLCLSVNFTQEANCVADLLRYAKEVNPEIITVIGGGEATLRKDWYLKNGADLVFSGECFKDVNSIPLPDFSLVDVEQYCETMGELPPNIKPPLMYLETSRSCPMACDFCQRSVLREPFRVKSASRVKEELDHYEESGIKTILICDENLMLRKREDLIEIFSYMNEKGFAWEFSVGIQFGKFMNNGEIDYELLRAMFAGCFRVLLPLEHLNDEKIEKEKKLISYEDEFKIIRKIIEKGCPYVHLGIIIGDTDETVDSLTGVHERCKELARLTMESQTKIHFSFYCKTPFYGTKYWNKAKHDLLFSIEEHPELWTVATSVIDGKGICASEITNIRKKLSEKLNSTESSGRIIRY